MGAIKRKNKVTVWLSDRTLDAIGNRKPSGVINQTIERVALAGEGLEIFEFDIDVSKESKRNHCGKYPDQSKVVNDFANATGRTIPESIVALDKIEREQSE